MSTYSTQTVAQLKELLKAKGLSTTGVKSDLVARLEEADNASSSAEVPAPEATETTAQAPAVTTETTSAADVNVEEEELLEIDEDSTEVATEEQPKEEQQEEPKPEKKQLTPEERKAAAIELITKRISRAKKFGTEEDVSKAEKDLARVEKFGVELGTALAREIGLASSEGLREYRPKKHGRHHKGFRNRVQKHRN